MPLTDNGLIVRRLIEIGINHGNLDIIDRYVSDTCIDHTFPRQTGIAGKEAIAWLIRDLHAGFPDVRYGIVDMVVMGERVGCHWEVQGTHQGEFFSIAPTWKRVSIAGVTIVRISQGRVVEHWSVMDVDSFVRQLKS